MGCGKGGEGGSMTVECMSCGSQHDGEVADDCASCGTRRCCTTPSHAAEARARAKAMEESGRLERLRRMMRGEGQ